MFYFEKLINQPLIAKSWGGEGASWCVLAVLFFFCVVSSFWVTRVNAEAQLNYSRRLESRQKEKKTAAMLPLIDEAL